MQVLVLNTIRAIRTLWSDQQFKSLTRLAVIAIGSGTIFYALVEDLRLVDSLYFSVMTLATVGYGDFAPKTDLGKLFTVVYALVGIGIMLAFLTRLAGQTAISHMEHRNGNGRRVRDRLRGRGTRERHR